MKVFLFRLNLKWLRLIFVRLINVWALSSGFVCCCNWAVSDCSQSWNTRPSAGLTSPATGLHWPHFKCSPARRGLYCRVGGEVGGDLLGEGPFHSMRWQVSPTLVRPQSRPRLLLALKGPRSQCNQSIQGKYSKVLGNSGIISSLFKSGNISLMKVGEVNLSIHNPAVCNSLKDFIDFKVSEDWVD